jgi:hypothetical protein
VDQSYVYTAEGRKRKTLYGKTRNEVSGKLTKAMSDRDGGLIFDAGKMTLGEYLDRWLVDSARGTVRTASPTGSTLSTFSPSTPGCVPESSSPTTSTPNTFRKSSDTPASRSPSTPTPTSCRAWTVPLPPPWK